MSMRLFNTLGRKIEDFKPSSKNEVKLYSCGPTVYNTAHIGNLRSFIMPDVLRRVLEMNGYDVNWVMNITDVDDKTIANTIKEFGPDATVENLKTFTDKYFQLFLEDLQKIGIDSSDISFVKVTEKIADIQLYILKLMEKGFAYKAEDGSTYFSIEKYQQAFGTYGQLVGEKFLEGKKVGARVKVDEYDKENLSDFALWKSHGPDDAQIYWDHPMLGKGRPGWHIECTLINYLKFPSGTDIHTGGVDLIFPHHTNEIAQAEPIYKPFVKYWVHPEHILVDNKKMAKREGSFFTLADLERDGITDGLAYRYLILQSHYRSKLNVTKESLNAAKVGLNNIRLAVTALNDNNANVLENEAFETEFKQALSDDLNTSAALAILSKVLQTVGLKNRKELILKMDEIFGLDLGKTPQTEVDEEKLGMQLQELMEKRKEARKNKDYKLSDELRAKIEAQGYELLDTAEGTKLRKKL